MDNPTPEPVLTKKGFLQVNITGFIFHPATEAEKTALDAPGDFVEVQPIMYDLFVPVTGQITEEEVKKIPNGMAEEILAVLHEVAAFVRNHTPNPNGLVTIGNGGRELVKAAPKPLLDSTGGVLSPTKH